MRKSRDGKCWLSLFRDNGIGAEVARKDILMGKDSVSVQRAWSLLSVVNDWIKNADAKATAVIALAGVCGAILASMFTSVLESSIYMRLLFSAAMLATVAALINAAIVLAPRTSLRNKRDSSLLFYADIFGRFSNRPQDLRMELSDLFENPDVLFDEITDQILVNSEIATKKFKKLRVSVWLLVSAFVLTVATALLASLL